MANLSFAIGVRAMDARMSSMIDGFPDGLPDGLWMGSQSQDF
jgi:hypothetical protein